MPADSTPQLSAPQVIALIDLSDLRLQVERMGGATGYDLAAVVERLEAGLAALDPAGSEARIAPAAVHVYAQPESGTGVECQACNRCTHCRIGPNRPGPRGLDNHIARALLRLARDDAYDWAVIVSTDVLLIPVIRYLQSHGRKIIHGRFPPIAADLSRECWASIDLRPT